MGKIYNLQILLQKPDFIYSPGETLIGCLCFKLTERVKIKKICVTLNGIGRCGWKSKIIGSQTGNAETYINSYQDLLTKTPTGEDPFLEPGEYSMLFNYVLPDSLPDSMDQFYAVNHTFGCITYEINGIVEMPAFLIGTSREERTVQFRIMSKLSIRSNPELLQPYKAESLTMPSTFCCFGETDPIMLEITLPKVAFVPGERIPFELTVKNNTAHEIKQLEVSFDQIIKYQALTGESKTIDFPVVWVVYPNGAIAANTTQKWTDKTELLIPPLRATLNGKSKIIEISYRLFVNMKASGYSKKNRLQVPIIIGSVS